jgi:hypothetical protein
MGIGGIKDDGSGASAKDVRPIMAARLNAAGWVIVKQQIP